METIYSKDEIIQLYKNRYVGGREYDFVINFKPLKVEYCLNDFLYASDGYDSIEFSIINLVLENRIKRKEKISLSFFEIEYLNAISAEDWDLWVLTTDKKTNINYSIISKTKDIFIVKKVNLLVANIFLNYKPELQFEFLDDEESYGLFFINEKAKYSKQKKQYILESFFTLFYDKYKIDLNTTNYRIQSKNTTSNFILNDYEVSDEDKQENDEMMIEWNLSQESNDKVCIIDLLKYSKAVNYYYNAISIKSTEFRFLAFYKVLENVASSVINKFLFSSLKDIVDKVSRPVEIEGLIKINNEFNKINRKLTDKFKIEYLFESLDINIEGYELPLYLSRLYRNLETDRQKMKKIGSITYNTRNNVVHAKDNYSEKNEKCKIEDLYYFTEFISKCAIISINLYNELDDDYKIKD